jgi:hypothetical protein
VPEGSGYHVLDGAFFSIGQLYCRPSPAYARTLTANVARFFGTLAPPSAADRARLGRGILALTGVGIAPLGGTIADRPSSIVTNNGSGTEIAETDYAYDQTSVSSVSATGHDNTNYPSGTGVARGNATTKTVKCLQTGCSNAVTIYAYDETGQVTSMTDPCGNGTCSDMGTSQPSHTTTYSYADSYTTGSNTCTPTNGPAGNTDALLTKITYPPANNAVHSECFSYDYNSGQLTGLKDENNQLTTYVYDDPFFRPTQANYPDGGQTTLSYNDSPYAPAERFTSTSRTILVQPVSLPTTLEISNNKRIIIRSVACRTQAEATATTTSLPAKNGIANPSSTILARGISPPPWGGL